MSGTTMHPSSVEGASSGNGTVRPEELPASAIPKISRPEVAHRIVQIGILVTLVWKWSFFVLASRVYADIPIRDDFFPAWLQSVQTVRIAYLGSIAAIALNIVVTSRTLQRLACWATLLGTSVLCLHQASYNDMTCVTAWWASLWATWFVYRLDDPDQVTMLRRAAFLSRLILSMILLGGGVGKWTAEYWSGDVFYDIYFRDRDFWVFNLLRERCDDATLQTMAMWYSRKVVVLETIAGLGLWLLPPKWAAAIAIIILMSIALLSNFLLFSVLSAPIALAAVGFLVLPKRASSRGAQA